MELNNNYVIMVTIDWHRVARIAYITLSLTSKCNYIYFDENC